MPAPVITRRSYLGVVAATAAALAAATSTAPAAAAATATGEAPTWISGVDLGMLLEIEEKGGIFSSDSTASSDAVTILARAGANLTRLRLWVDPYTVDGQPYGGGTNDLARTITLAQRARDAGMSILLDLHLSDWWADPGTQTKPKAWRGLSGDALVSQVRSYTASVISAMAAAGVRPAMVQMGNEISSGLLWDDGKVGDGQGDFTNLSALLTAGFAGVEDAAGSGPRIERVLHLDMGGDNALYRWWFDGVTSHDVDFDVIGLSYYPFWHRSMGELKANLNDLTSRYGKDILIVETAYGWTLDDGDGITNSFYTKEEAAGGYPATVEGQTAYLRDLRDLIVAVPDGHGRGYVWWEPAWLPVPGANWGTEAGKLDNDDDGVLGNPWDNQTLFDFDGHALATMEVLGEEPRENLLANASFEVDGFTTSPSSWGVWAQDEHDRDAVFVSSPGIQGSYKLTHWKATSYVASTYQVLGSLPSGRYRLDAWALSSGDQSAAYAYVKLHGGTERQVALPASSSVWRPLRIDDITVTTGTMEVGFYSDANAGSWINVDDVRLTRLA